MAPGEPSGLGTEQSQVFCGWVGLFDTAVGWFGLEGTLKISDSNPCVGRGPPLVPGLVTGVPPLVPGFVTGGATLGARLCQRGGHPWCQALSPGVPPLVPGLVSGGAILGARLCHRGCHPWCQAWSAGVPPLVLGWVSGGATCGARLGHQGCCPWCQALSLGCRPWCHAWSPGCHPFCQALSPGCHHGARLCPRCQCQWWQQSSVAGVKSEQSSPCSHCQHVPWDCATPVQQILAHRAGCVLVAPERGWAALPVEQGCAGSQGKGLERGAHPSLQQLPEEPQGSLEMQTEPRAPRAECPLGWCLGRLPGTEGTELKG
ncbi:uncharacterized protein LOC127060514 isoform X2 [Serinus canaria]|uniref:uncharacterized protein LOC127060514 isoform X2 n=1 Tax=Serinus canaria TaxID=9135 RepID=UPI0021CCADA2|nr:uncharacterized protein LOC127060514 isoform X2 [Serinus canaria]XP_050840153.1 uncharacterized protein LOC127060514 isoform X2 [Serinus canaria]XP_050840158.1 uncharacterized protein LOC127060514 isoform X2 [Serinus canaria]XP_050840164.1 uncharacterized protein LOC127060514 isoform X2 [Serinus canaria]XP_050840167.1 uncharacterized protein LOC127060514 isoform X2 [Serinus canaria]XP_050840173.1 uncharacterized protein LOC127060514 isoform X2 [Serinus canaria]XP_050840176.1 uncharacterize